MIYMNFRTDSVSTPRPCPPPPRASPLPNFIDGENSDAKRKICFNPENYINSILVRRSCENQWEKRSCPASTYITTPRLRIYSYPVCLSPPISLSERKFSCHTSVRIEQEWWNHWLSRYPNNTNTRGGRGRDPFSGTLGRKLAKSSAPKILSSLALTHANQPTLLRNKEEIGLWQAGAFGTVWISSLAANSDLRHKFQFPCLLTS